MPNTLKTYETLIVAVRDLQDKWQRQPMVFLACARGSDEHWQIWHPDEMFPSYTVSEEEGLAEHPDCPRP